MTQRQCGSCSLCCKLLPVHDSGLHKAAGKRCPHQRSNKGCAIYERRPMSCRLWNCRWLVNDDTANMSRPDRVHYVIDIVPDFITLTEPDKPDTKIEVVQVWVDQKFPDAHRDPDLRAFLIRRGTEGVAAIIRYSSSDAFVLFPPSMTADGEWHEHDGTCKLERAPTELFAGLAEARQYT